MKAGAVGWWQGEWIVKSELSSCVDALPNTLDGLSGRRLECDVVVNTCEAFAQELLYNSVLRKSLCEELIEGSEVSPTDAMQALDEVIPFLRAKALKTKLVRELGSEDPFSVRTLVGEMGVYEAWAPMGSVLHICPANAWSVSCLATLEGLLCGNVNIVKLSSDSSLFCARFFAELCRFDVTQTLRDFVMIARFSSSQQKWLQGLLRGVDVVSAWGGEESIASLREQTPSSTRFVAWGHKISFAYVTPQVCRDTLVLRKIAEEICTLEQQACSSPQCIFLDTDSYVEAEHFAQSLAHVLSQVSAQHPQSEASAMENAEITMTVEVHKAREAMEEARVFEDDSHTWRLLLDSRRGLTGSPLYRTAWVRALPRNTLSSALRPLRSYLQTVGLACTTKELPHLTQLLTGAGVNRIRPIGLMTAGYNGEPHDGVYALPQFSKRMSLQFDAVLKDVACLDDLIMTTENKVTKRTPILTKAEFQEMKVDREHSHLYFRSGGSSGEPKLSIFDYADYHSQMRAAADGLVAAGLDPTNDTCMNLFFGGGLYGGFLSFFTILEFLRVRQFPMAAHMDFEFVAQMIERFQVDVLLGMPSYLMQFFENQKALLKKSRCIKKVFFGGEHFNLAQRNYLMREFGVEHIVSATYGSVDAGPIGYQCLHCAGSVHHLHTRLHQMEIVKLECDEPAEGVGRILLSSKMRRGQPLLRYEIGDLGRWVHELCGCGRQTPRFELLGRSGDVFRAAGCYFNYAKMAHILESSLGYDGELQVRIVKQGHFDALVVALDQSKGLNLERATEALLNNYSDLAELVQREKSLLLNVVQIPSSQFVHTSGSGKLIRVKDER